MAERLADVATPNARSYLGRICGHFAHKLPVERDGDVGTLRFEDGRCNLAADDQRLRLRVLADDDVKAAAVADVVERHVLRFATREGLTVHWTAVDPP